MVSWRFRPITAFPFPFPTFFFIFSLSLQLPCASFGLQGVRPSANELWRPEELNALLALTSRNYMVFPAVLDPFSLCLSIPPTTSARRSLEADRALASIERPGAKGKGEKKRKIHLKEKSIRNLVTTCFNVWPARQIEDNYCPTDRDYAKKRSRPRGHSFLFCPESVFPAAGSLNLFFMSRTR